MDLPDLNQKKLEVDTQRQRRKRVAVTEKLASCSRFWKACATSGSKATPWSDQAQKDTAGTGFFRTRIAGLSLISPQRCQ